MIGKLIAPLAGLVKRRQRIRLRRIMRGYRLLRQAGRLDRIAAVKRALTETPISPTSQKFSAVVMGQGAESGEIIVRQYLLTRVGGLNLNRALLLASGKQQGRVSFPLPKEWRAILVSHGFEVAHLRSAVLWQLYVCAHLLRGMAKIGRIALRGIVSAGSAEPVPKRHVYFADLGPRNLPQEANGCKSHDVISWYLQWPGKTKEIEAVHHSVSTASRTAVGSIAVLPQQGPLPDLHGLRAALNYASWGLRAGVIAALDGLRGRWWHALLLNQAALAAQARTLPAASLAQDYLFHNSDWIFRPLWTYEAEQKGSSITFYFYSTNCEAFKKTDGYPPPSYGWKAMTWPRYLVWNEYQADFVRRAVGAQARISTVGSIWFQSSAIKPPPLPKKTLAVFDVQPVRASFYSTLALDFDYYTAATANQFLTDLCRIVKEQDCALALKRKRQIGQLAHPSYRRCVEALEASPHFFAVEPDTSALRLIEDCDAVVSMPFTSTALLGRDLGKPSIYYDPHGVLQKDDRAAHGIEILCGPDELSDWLTVVMSANRLREVNHA